MHHSEVSNVRTHPRTHPHTQTHRQAESNMPFQLFQSWGHNNLPGNLHLDIKNNYKKIIIIMALVAE